MTAGKQTLKSCESCRSAKAKCISNPDPNVHECLRCIKYNKECFYAELKPRPKRGKQAHTRVSEVEKRVENLLHSEQQTASEGSKRASTHDSEGTLTNSVTNENSDLDVAVPQEVRVVTIRSEPQHGRSYRERDAIDKDILSEKEALELLQRYRQASRNFPFVYIDPQVTLEALRNEKPFLLLSLLTASSQRARYLQILLEKELRETLASKLIIEGELSLDVLQGLLVYLAWYHNNFRPCRQQVYQLVQLCGSMVIDLGLHKPPDVDPGFVLHPTRGCMANKVAATPMASRADGIRTFIGAYYLTTSLSIMLRKPNGMIWSPYLERCCKELAEHAEAPGDTFLIHYVRLTHLTEEISSTFGYCSPEPDLDLSHQRVQGTVRAFVTNAQQIAKSFPQEVYSMPSIISLFHTAPNLASEIILHLDARAESISTPASNSTSSAHDKYAWYNSTIRTSMLLAFIDTISVCLDWFLTLSIYEFECFNLLDCSRISYHLFLLGRLTLSGVPGSEVDIVSQTLKLHAYFDAFLEKFQQLAVLQAQEERKNIYWHMHQTLLASRDWFSDRIAERIQDGGPVDPVIAAKIQPNFAAGPWGIVDLDKQKDELSIHYQPKAVSSAQNNVRAVTNGNASDGAKTTNINKAWQAAMAALPAKGIEGSWLF